MNKKENRLV